MGEKRGMKALEVWCRRVTDGYKDVSVENMSSSWRDGLAFCALIHHFHPELIEFESLNKENILRNNQLAFSIAEKHLGIPALLEAEDMVKYKVPDKLSIMTYVSQFYQCFQGNGRTTMSPSKKRPLESNETGSSTPSPDSPSSKLSDSPSSLPRRYDVCQTCHQRVYILERLIIDSKLYHRTCFKCSRCKTVLKPGSYVEGNLPGQYECVSCPDEEEAEKAAVASMAANRVARLTSPTESWQPLRIRQPMEFVDLKLTTSVAEARMNFLKDFNPPEGSANISFNDKDIKMQTSANLSNNQKRDENEEEKTNDGCENITIKPLNLPFLMKDALPLTPITPIALAPLALPEEAVQTAPVPSPRMRRKKSSTSEMDLNKTKEIENEIPSDDVFLTPLSSPLPSLRRVKQPEDTTDGAALGKITSTATVKVKPIAALRQSKSLEAGTDGITPSKIGAVISDMPVIRSPVTISPQSVRSPTKSRTTEDISRSREGSPKVSSLSSSREGSPKSSVPWSTRRTLSPPTVRSPNNDLAKDDVMSSREGSPQPPPKPKRLSAAIETSNGQGDIGLLAPKKRTGVDNNNDDDNNSNNNKLVETKGVCEEKVKKVPPPRPELPAFLKAATLSSTSTLSNLSNVTVEEEYPDELNPFNDEDEAVVQSDNASFKSCEDKKSLNPFDSDEDDEQVSVSEVAIPVSKLGSEKKHEAPAGSNPFGSDDEDEDEVSLDQSLKEHKPTPLPRRGLDSRSTDVSPAGSVGRHTGQKYRGSYSADTSPAGSIGKAAGSKYSPFNSPTSTNSDTSGRRTSKDSGLDVSPTGSLSRGFRKKRQAPLPPGPPPVPSPSVSHKPSPRSVKKSPAPPPPPVFQSKRSLASPSSDNEINEKAIKEMDNLTLKSSGSDTAGNDGLSSPSPQETVKPINTFGYWKKKKPAPPVPLPPKRQQIIKLPMEEILKELKNIEEKQLEMEKRGVELEKAIREENLQENEDTVDGEESELVLQLFDLVNQKNAMFRRQAELVYLRRQQRLEEEHAELEYQIRCLMGKPETIKTDEDRELEEELIQRLMEVVRQRNEIIESMETDRLREAVEDQSIQYQMTLRQASSSRSLLSSSSSNSVESQVKKEKKKKKDKLKKNKAKEKCKDVDEDKDLDETETDENKEKTKKEKKRKWF